jgi:serine/threonine-protein kinase
VGYVLQACEGIAEAHALGIVHRDLKPSNLFLARRPQGSLCVKVLDFGISKQTAGAEGELTKTGVALGTPFYMSPEQMTQTKDVDARADVWAMGVILYKLITGQLPFQGNELMAVIARVLQEEPLAPSQVRPGLPASIDAVVLRCLQKPLGLRFQSIDELSKALRAIVGAGAGAGMAAGSRASTPTLVGVGQWTGASPTPITPILMGAMGAARGQTHLEARRTRSRTIRRSALGGALGLLLMGGVGAWWALRSEPSARAAVGLAQSGEGTIGPVSAAPAEGQQPLPGEVGQRKEEAAPIELKPPVGATVQTPNESEKVAASGGEATPPRATVPRGSGKSSGKHTGPRNGDGDRAESKTPTVTLATTSASAAASAAEPLAAPTQAPKQYDGLF